MQNARPGQDSSFAWVEPPGPALDCQETRRGARIQPPVHNRRLALHLVCIWTRQRFWTPDKSKPIIAKTAVSFLRAASPSPSRVRGIFCVVASDSWPSHSCTLLTSIPARSQSGPLTRPARRRRLKALQAISQLNSKMRTKGAKEKKRPTPPNSAE